MKFEQSLHGAEIAIVGMACKLPMANNLADYWQNLLAGQDCISRFTEAELIEAGLDETQVSQDDYVKAKGMVEDANGFDANFFGYGDRESLIMDPQLRLYHEAAYNALEDAGIQAKQDQQQLIGIFGGASANSSWLGQFTGLADKGGAQAYEAINLISRDFFNTRLAYNFDFKGPAVTIQTACSTGLVAVHQACQSLLSGDCDVALAGAVSLSTNPKLNAPEKQGYAYQEGMILSQDGYCRPFDHNSGGTVLSDGVGMVVLKRLDDALENNDRIYCLIKGSAVNNDGDDKIGYTAPSVQGQQEVIMAALDSAEVEPQDIDFIETHGTGTKLGDPIEIKALAACYPAKADGAYHLGAVKANLGHLDTAAGMAGLIKSALTIYHRTMAPAVHFNEANDKCGEIPQVFAPPMQAIELPADKLLGGAVSSFGIGGTNAHVILEQAKSPESAADDVDVQILPYSAKHSASVSQYSQALQDFLNQGKLKLNDVAYTLQQRRASFEHRGAMVFNGQTKQQQVFQAEVTDATTVFMFSSQGTQQLSMAKGLYHQLPQFAAIIDQCHEQVAKQSDVNLRELLVDGDHLDQAQLNDTAVAQICLFVFEYALAKQLMYYGVEPDALIGHSLGEYTAACIAGVFSVEDAITLVLARGKLMARTRPGAMVAVAQSVAQVKGILPAELSIAAHNGEQAVVVSGAAESMDCFTQTLDAKAIGYKRLQTSGGFHSELMDEIKPELKAVLDSITINAPQLPIISNVSGKVVSDNEVTTADYWLAHLRGTVRFHDGLTTLVEQNRLLIEVGPGSVLCNMAQQHPEAKGRFDIIAAQSLKSGSDSLSQLYAAVAKAYVHGAAIQWSKVNPQHGKVTYVPPYAFNHKQYIPALSQLEQNRDENEVRYFRQKWLPVEHHELLSEQQATSGITLLLAQDDAQADVFSEHWASQPQAEGLELITVTNGSQFSRSMEGRYRIAAQQPADLENLFTDLLRLQKQPNKIIVLGADEHSDNPYLDFDRLAWLVQAINKVNLSEDVAIVHVSQGMVEASGEEQLNPNAALAFGPVRVMGQEQENISGHIIDVPLGRINDFAKHIFAAVAQSDLPFIMALRKRFAWLPELETTKPVESVLNVKRSFVEGGRYILTGGFGGLGQALAKHLAQSVSAKLVLCSRTDRSDDPLLADIKALGGEAVALQVDFSEPGAIAIAADCASSNFAGLDGIVHLAGLPGETMMQRFEQNAAHKVLDSKIAAVEQMIELTAKMNLDMLVLYSSVTGILGGFGQCEYTAANAYLDVAAQKAHSAGLTQVVALNWDTWKDTGMAFNALNGGTSVLAANVHPLLGSLVLQNEQVCCFKQSFSNESQWVMSEHLVMNRPTVPGTSYLDMAAAAFTHLTGKTEKRFEQVYFINPLAVKGEEVKDVYTMLTPQGDNRFGFEVGSFCPESKIWLQHVRGNISGETASDKTVAMENLVAQHDKRHLTQIDGAAHLGLIAMGQAENVQTDHLMKYGNRWNVFDQVWLGTSSAIAELALPDAHQGDVSYHQLHPSLLDCALSFFRPFVQDGVYIPFSIGRLSQLRTIDQQLFSVVTLNPSPGQGKEVLNFTVELFNRSGQLVARVDDFAMHRIEQNLFDAPVASSGPIPPFVNQYKQVKRGLPTAAALNALEQVLESPGSNLVVATPSFAERYANAELGDSGGFDDIAGQSKLVQPRPDLAVDYVAPTNEAQQQVAAIWQQVLGLEKVGIMDDFFELNGNSLMLMQVHKQLQSTFDTQVSVAELYNYPTIEKLVTGLFSATDEVEKLADEVADRNQKQKAAAARRRRRNGR